MSTSAGRVWFVTGANSGFGRAIAEAAVAAGDVVVAAARRPSSLDTLVAAHPDQIDAVELDVTDQSRISTVVEDVIRRHGRIDVLVNNAGRQHPRGSCGRGHRHPICGPYSRYISSGPAALIRAVLPHMRKRRTGAIVQMSSMGGQMSFAGFSAYSATKFALEGLSEALADEVRDFGIKVLIVEPGAFRTGLFENSTQSTANSAYVGSVAQTREYVSTGDGSQPGDPAKAANAIRSALASDRTPLRLPLGSDGYDAISNHLDAVREELTTWESIARDTANQLNRPDRRRDRSR